MNYIAKKKLNEIQQGDIVNIEPMIANSVFSHEDELKKYIVNFTNVCPNQNLSPTFDIICYGYNKFRNINVNDSVYYFGTSPYIDYLPEDVRKQKAKEMFDTIKHRFTNAMLSKLNTVYYVKLFGKRGRYEEYGDRTYFNQSYVRVKNLVVKLATTDKKIVAVETKKYDDIDTSYSRAYETECYGGRHCNIHIIFEDGEKYSVYM